MTNCSPQDITVMVLILLVDAWLGRTEKTKYSSILELLTIGTATLIVVSFVKIIRGGKNG